MDQSLQKNAISTLIGLALILGLKWINAHWIHEAQTIKSGSFSYEMPRPKSYANGFDLSGREIEREVLTDEELLAKSTKEAKDKATKLAEAAKKADAGKKAAEANKKKQAKIDQASLSVATVDTSMEMTMDRTSANYNSSKSSVDQNSVVAQPPHAAAVANPAPAQNQPKLSAAQWLTLLTNHASTLTINDFIQAHLQGQISNPDFYSVAFSLFNSQTQQQQQVGTEILTNDGSQAELLYVSQKYGNETSAEQATLWTIMQTFAQPIKFQGLNMALSSNNASSVPLALKILGIAVQNAQNQVSTQGGSGGTRGVAGSIQPSALLQFDTNLSQIANSGSGDAQTAQTLLGEIQALNK